MPDVGPNYSLPSAYFVQSGDTIIPSQHNGPMEDLAAALNRRMMRNGTAAMTGNLQMGGNRVTGMAAGTQPTDSARMDQIVPVGGGTVTGSLKFGANYNITSATGFGAFVGLYAETGNFIAQARAAAEVTTPLFRGFHGVNETFRVSANGSLAISGSYTGSGAGLTNIPDAALPDSVMRTAWNLTAGSGLTGGGSGAANRTISMGTPSSVGDTTTNAVTGTSHTHEIGPTIARSATRTDAGAGLMGGGSHAADRTISMGTPSAITPTSTDSATGSTHSHSLSNATVRVLIAQSAPGVTGTFIFAKFNANLNPGSIVSGGNLYPARMMRPGSDWGGRAVIDARATSLTGSWMCLGWSDGANDSATLFMRVE